MNKPTVIVFVEQAIKDQKYLLLDFPANDPNDYESVFVNYFSEINKSENEASMIEIEGIGFTDGNFPEEDQFYELSMSFFDGIKINKNNGSNHIGYKIDGHKHFRDMTYFKEVDEKSFCLIINQAKPYSDEEIKFSECSINKERSEIRILKVGQGNCNIFSNNNCLIIYDLGGTEVDICAVIGSEMRKLTISRILESVNNVIFILSHWDIDHYNGLLGLADDEISVFNRYILPNILQSKTSKRVYNRIHYHNKNAIVNIDISINGNNSDLVRLDQGNNRLNLYKASKFGNRNTSGIVLTYETDSKFFMLSGDHNYKQLDKLITRTNEKSIYLVAPHHGGDAGDHRLTKNWKGLKEICFSYGKNNRWNHPDFQKKYFKTEELFTIQSTTENCEIKWKIED